MLQIPLSPGLPGGSWACLRVLCGHDEAAIEGIHAMEVTALLDRLLIDVPGTSVGPGRAWDLALSDRDRLLAAVYMQYFGERIESTVPCRACEHGFELNFSLRTLMGDLSPHQNACVTGPDDNGIYTLADGRRFRLPTAADQRRVLGFETEQATTALLESCIVGGEPGSDLETLQTAMATVGPIVDLDLNASCPECGSEQIVRFDIQSYLLQVLAHEKRFLNGEIHRIATVYGWGAREILGLSRDDRRTYVRLIEADRTAVRRTR